MKHCSEWTRKEFEELPSRKWDEDIGSFSELIILPLRQVHDSGYRCLDFVAVKDGVPFCRLSGCSDVIHLEGIGGYGFNWLELYGRVPDAIPSSDLSIDCLKKSGLLRIFSRKPLVCGMAISSFNLYTLNESKPNKGVGR